MIIKTVKSSEFLNYNMHYVIDNTRVGGYINHNTKEIYKFFRSKKLYEMYIKEIDELLGL